jgi:signal peptidase II
MDERRQPGARRRFEIWVPLLVVAVDQLTKAMVREMLPLHASVPIVAGFLDFTHVRNTGAAFGLLDGADFPLKGTLIAVIALGALVAVGVYSVVDFVDVYWRTYHFWAFNVADSAITVGVAIMIIDMLGTGSHVSKTA